MKKILIIEDELNIYELIKFNLETHGFEVDGVQDGGLAIDKILEVLPDLIILDLMLPGKDGISICREIRANNIISYIPIIMLTAKSEEFDKVLGLEIGADDYITKPFDPKELIARVKAVLRRGQPEQQDNDMLSFPGLTISLSRYEVLYQGKQAEMPPKEIELFYFLASHPNTVFTREQLLEKVWGFDYFGDSRTVDVHVKRLREKLTDCEELGWSIKTVWSVGYKFEVK